MKFGILNLLILILLVAVGLGWWVDHTHLEMRLTESTTRLDAIHAGSICRDASAAYYQSLATHQIDDERLTILNEEELLFAFMQLFKHRENIEVFLSHKNKSANLDRLPKKILLMLDCRKYGDFLEKFRLRYPHWILSIEQSNDGLRPLKNRICDLLENIDPQILREFDSERASFSRNFRL